MAVEKYGSYIFNLDLTIVLYYIIRKEVNT